MILNSRKTIDEVQVSAEKILGEKHVRSFVLVDNKDIYDIRMKIIMPIEGQYSPSEIALSYDVDTGYYMNIDGITWEFRNDVEAFKSESIRYIRAIKDGKAFVKEKRFLGKILISKDLIIEDDLEG